MYKYNYRTGQEDAITHEELSNVSAERGRDFVPRINLGPEMIGDGPAVGLYDCLVAQGWEPVNAIEEVHRTLLKEPA